MEKILEKKIKELNIIKGLLIKRGENIDCIKVQMKYLVDDIELILRDLGYIKYSMNKYKLSEVAKYTGEDGGVALVVVKGTVYDVTHLTNWKNGKHFGVMAGRDLTEYFKKCHCGEINILNKCRIVGVLEE